VTQTYKPDIARALIAQGLVILVPLVIGAVYLFLVLGTSAVMVIPFMALVFFFPVFPMIVKLFFEKYELTIDGIKHYSGIIAKQQVTIMKKQIQDVGLYQQWIDRIFGLAEVQIRTMSSTHRLLKLSLDDANSIRAVLLPKKEIGESGFNIHALRKTLVYLAVVIASFLFLPELVFLISLLVIGVIIYNHATSYELTKNEVIKNFVFFAKSRIHIQYDKIQNIIVRRGIIDQLLGLSTLTIETGGHADEQQRTFHSYVIPCLLKEDAGDLQEEILSKMNVKTDITSLREHYPLSKLKPIKKTVKYTWYFAVLSIVVAIGLSIDWFTTVLVVLLFLVVVLAYQIVYYITYQYSDNKQILKLKKGVFLETMLVIPYDRLQHIIIDQDVFDKIFGLYDVHVSSAGTTRMELHIDGLRKEVAEELKHLLVGRAIL
jgi:membrane protein YdbS with pleckstrin-like domain